MCPPVVGMAGSRRIVGRKLHSGAVLIDTLCGWQAQRSYPGSAQQRCPDWRCQLQAAVEHQLLEIAWDDSWYWRCLWVNPYGACANSARYRVGTVTVTVTPQSFDCRVNARVSPRVLPCRIAAPLSKVRQRDDACLGCLLQVAFSTRNAHFRRSRSSAFAP